MRNAYAVLVVRAVKTRVVKTRSKQEDSKTDLRETMCKGLDQAELSQCKARCWNFCEDAIKLYSSRKMWYFLIK